MDQKKIRKNNKDFFEEQIKKGVFIIEGEFENEYGEKFVLMYHDSDTNKSIAWITGDEFDWEIGYFCRKDGMVYKQFLTSEKETQEIIKILNK